MRQAPAAGEFGPFFESLNGYPPFPWQRRLAESACAGSWPETLALPTSSGKTACIDIAVFALACQAALEPARRTAARRIFFVVDRRLIVDEAFERARRIAEKLRDHPKSQAILARVAAALREVGGLGVEEPPLAVGQLRGGIYRDQVWARTPTQPTVLASTVDQVGSRLLFRGYGLSPSLRPIHAGLAANDALILLDEAHCSNPFRQTAEAIEGYRRAGRAVGLTTPFRFSILSATPPPPDGAHPGAASKWEITDEDRADGVLGPRLAASKPVTLNAVKKGRASLVAGLAGAALGMVEGRGARTVAAFVNRVATARSLRARLLESGGDRREVDVVLMTGRMRPIDRDELIGRWGRFLRAGAKDEPERPIIVVATQCLEVGADFDFEGVVTECASLDALRQRFGRLNRLGARPGSRGVILIAEDQIVPDEEAGRPDPRRRDPIYGEALPRTWNWLSARSTPRPEGGTEAPEIDFGIEALGASIGGFQSSDPDGWRRLLMPAPDAPVMLPSHVDRWAQTSTTPEDDPDVALFLHGPAEAQAEVDVFWRADLPRPAPGLASESYAEILSLCPPGVAECMRVPLAAFRRWLAGSSDSDETSDLEHLPEAESDPADEADRAVFLWRGADGDESMLTRLPGQVRPGDKVAILAEQVEAIRILEALGTMPDAESTDPDLGERAFARSRRRAILRLHPARIACWPGVGARGRLEAMLREDDPAPMDRRREWQEALGQLAEDLSEREDWRWLAEVARSLEGDDRLEILLAPERPDRPPIAEEAERGWGGVVLVGSRPFPGGGEPGFAGDSQTTEGDDGSIGRPVTLADHTRGVTALARKYAEACGLPPSLVDAIVAAAEWHDLGKLDRRFQSWLRRAPLPDFAPAGGLGAGRGVVSAPPGVRRDLPALAKGLGMSREARRRARIRSGYPDGARHELVSMRLAERLLDRLGPDVDRDLVLHLIAAHHGHARPFAPTVRDEEPVQVRGHELGHPVETSSATGLHRLGAGVGDRFWSLTRRYGWWGLAWLESILRLADHRRSEAEQAAVGRADR